MALYREVDTWLLKLRGVFGYQVTFYWFAMVVWGFLLRPEGEGVTSLIRCLGLAPGEYLNLLHFFRSSAFSVRALTQRWAEAVLEHPSRYELDGRPVYLADAIVTDKTGRHMPGVKKLHRTAGENRPEYPIGHFWGAVSVLVHAGERYFALPLRFQLQDGLRRSPSEKTTVITRMGQLIAETAVVPGTVVADSYYACRVILEALLARGFHFIGRVRINTVAYEAPVPLKKRRRGRPKKRGAKVHLRELFRQPDLFTVAQVDLYGETQRARLLERVLLWQGRLVKFVLSIDRRGRQAIFLSTNLDWSAVTIVNTYSLRFKIEVSFKALVQRLWGMAYHFWLKAMPARTARAPDLYLHRASAQYRESIYRKVEAYERFVNCAAIAQGLLQLLSISYAGHLHQRLPIWFRTVREKTAPSEHLVRAALQGQTPRIFSRSEPTSLLAKILSERARVNAAADPPQRAA
jgi:hypothetical protein